MPETEFHLKLPTDETIEKLDRMAKEHADKDVRFLAEAAAGYGRSILSVVNDGFPAIVKLVESSINKANG
jgi:hypothetical protein